MTNLEYHRKWGYIGWENRFSLATLQICIHERGITHVRFLSYKERDFLSTRNISFNVDILFNFLFYFHWWYFCGRNVVWVQNVHSGFWVCSYQKWLRVIHVSLGESPTKNFIVGLNKVTIFSFSSHSCWTKMYECKIKVFIMENVIVLSQHADKGSFVCQNRSWYTVYNILVLRYPRRYIIKFTWYLIKKTNWIK